MKDKKIVFVDVDDVSALLHVVWLKWYNEDYNDNFTVKDWISWGVENLVKPECGLKIYSYLKNPKIYDDVKPRKGAVEGVNALRELGYRVLFATSSPIEVIGRKFYWLKDWGFEPKERDYIEIRDKSLLKGDYLFDDSFDNIRTFSGCGYLLTRPWNKDYLWNNRVKDWNGFIEIMKSKAEKGL